MIILGIETSCDETGIALLEKNGQSPIKILSNVVASSLHLHAKTGGIIPEIAAREQVKLMTPTLIQALKDGLDYEFPSKKPPAIDAIAITYGPGLIGSLLVGVETAKTLSMLWNKPLIPVNHMYGHLYANWICAKGKEQNGEPSTLSAKPYAQITFPAIVLIVSGGHTDLLLMKGHNDITVLGGTRDDAAGEAFDKIGRLLNLPYPAGPTIAKLAEKGDPKAFKLPRPMWDSKDYDFSFSGLKTAVLNLTKTNQGIADVISRRSREIPRRSLVNTRDDKLLADLCASVEQAIVDVLIKKSLQAAKEYKAKSILLGGGVAANKKLRNQLSFEIGNFKLEIGLFVPSAQLCTDNGTMIAAAGFFTNQAISWKDVNANPQLYY